MMIFTLNPNGNSRTISFSQPSVTIGSTGDISLPGEQLQEKHIQIVQQDGHFVAINLANDPFAMLNSLPFGKKVLSNYDLLQIGNTEIQFETAVHPCVAQNAAMAAVENSEFADKIPAPPEEQNPLDVDDGYFFASHPVVVDEDETDSNAGEEGKEKKPRSLYAEFELRYNWPLFIGICFGVLAAAFIVIGMIYINVSGRSDVESTIAAEGVADVAMALTYAQVNQIAAQKQNWFDPDFLKNNLASVLSVEYTSFAHIDNQGQFSNCPYFLRIYTSSDLSQFIVIAQPAPSLLQWLVPKASIIVDSTSMQMRNISDLRALNRLLTSANTLDHDSSIEISRLVKQGELIPLDSLPAEKGFHPPKALALLRPGAENLIYNAPRYYHFGETLLKKAVSLLQIVGSSHEVARLQQQLTELSKMTDLVLYSSQGMQKAINAQKALSTLAPNTQFLTAYLTLDGNGKVTNSRLLLNDDYPDFLSTHFLPSTEKQNPIFHPTEIPSDITAMAAPTPQAQPPKSLSGLDAPIDPHHPLLLQLNALSMERQRSLKTVSDRMIALLHGHNEGSVSAFSDSFSKLLRWYEQLDRQYQDKIMKELVQLYREYADMPLSQFAAYVQAARLDVLAQDTLKTRGQSLSQNPVNKEQVAAQLGKIGNAVDLSDLDQVVTETAGMLNLTRMPHPEQVIAYQNEMRAATVQKVRSFLLSSDKHLPKTALHNEAREALMHLLKTAWVIDPDECEFYLSEFDLRKDEG